MTERRWLDGYAGQTTEALLAMEDGFRPDSIVLALEAGIAAKAERLGGTDRLTEAERVVLAVEALEREVNNDGFDGLFRVAADIVPGLEGALRAIGRADVAEIAAEAIAALRLSGGPTPDAVAAAMEIDDEERDERLGHLDERYYDTAGDLADPLLAYIRGAIASVVLP